MDLPTIQRLLLKAGVLIDTGLSADEFQRIESAFGFTFPPDLREFLSLGLPVSPSWVDWRRADEGTLRERLDWPFEGMCFDIANNAFWMEEWGEKPRELAAAYEIAREALRNAPILIPICSHRFIPETPREPGNPVFSVYQTDIIYCGTDLIDYFQNEFSYYFGRASYSLAGTPKKIPFWSAFAEA
jgi:hypothetical protein